MWWTLIKMNLFVLMKTDFDLFFSVILMDEIKHFNLFLTNLNSVLSSEIEN